MGKFKVIVKPTAEKDLKNIKKSGDKKSIKRVEKIIHELSEHPKVGTGNPERLKHELVGLWSRRINKKDRLIYEIIESPLEEVIVISALGHY